MANQSLSLKQSQERQPRSFAFQTSSNKTNIFSKTAGMHSNYLQAHRYIIENKSKAHGRPIWQYNFTLFIDSVCQFGDISINHVSEFLSSNKASSRVPNVDFIANHLPRGKDIIRDLSGTPNSGTPFPCPLPYRSHTYKGFEDGSGIVDGLYGWLGVPHAWESLDIFPDN